MDEFFKLKPEVKPTIYVYSLPGVIHNEGYLKIGFTSRVNFEERLEEQLHVTGLKAKVELLESAMRPDGTCFFDTDIHNILKRKGKKQLDDDPKSEWFQCSLEDIKSAILEEKNGIITDASRTETFHLRPEQYRAIEMTKGYFIKTKKEEPSKPPKFLWNCKMRFGKTFAAYKLAKEMDLKKILVLTFKPAVESAWKDDLLKHIDFEGWQFVSDKDAKYDNSRLDYEFEQCDKNKPIVVFASFQNVLGVNDAGGIKVKNEFIHATHWDIIIFDEYHFGAWRENAKKLFEDEDEESIADFDIEKYKRDEADNAYNETFLPITTNYYLFLSGTPFRAINSGEFIEDQIFNWTYSDEQKAKENWKGSDNPYLSLPRMVLMTYQIPDSIRQVAMNGEFNEFDLNLFFAADGKGDKAKFKYENEVQKWLDLIRGQYLSASLDDLKLGQDKRPPMPFSDTRLLNVLSHTIWFLPNVASCEAMYNLLKQKQNTFYHDYAINLCAGPKAGIGLDALTPVVKSMERDNKTPLETKTITLTCGKLTTGVTVRPWTGIFMLRNLKSPETYFQSAFRVQSPWTIKYPDKTEEIIKNECYVFDFALDRALRQISDYSCRLNINEDDPEKKVDEFIQFLPVLAYDGSTMKQINAQDVLDIALAGTSATLLARRWESALLVNVDNETLTKLLSNQEALDALMSIEGFRSLNQDIETIINKSEHVKKVKKEHDTEGELTKKEKKELTEEEKEFKSKRKEIQEKLIKFATRIPVFMYLTDYREKCLKDVITQLEPGLFKKVTGLKVEDFNMLCHLGVFNSSLMNDAIFKFKRYEDSSLSYTGIEKCITDEIGGWDTVIRREEYEKLFYNQQYTMSVADDDNVIYEISDVVLEQSPGDVDVVTIVKPTEKEEKTKCDVDVAKIVEGAKVYHKKFGEGIIAKVFKTSKYLIVKFDVGEKTFANPNAFYDGHLIIKE